MQIRFQDPATDFNDGLGVIRAYHDSLLVHGRRLLEQIEAIGAHGPDAARSSRLAQLYSYYQRANTLHHLDEERALFPVVVGKDLLIDGMIERLTLDHEEIEEAWRVLEIALREILEHQGLPDQLEEKATRFEKLQREHLLRENEDFLPRLDSILTASQRQETGRVMAAMRTPRRKGPETR